jgi:hypothetical protein
MKNLRRQLFPTLLHRLLHLINSFNALHKLISFQFLVKSNLSSTNITSHQFYLLFLTRRIIHLLCNYAATIFAPHYNYLNALNLYKNQRTYFQLERSQSQPNWIRLYSISTKHWYTVTKIQRSHTMFCCQSSFQMVKAQKQALMFVRMPLNA